MRLHVREIRNSCTHDTAPSSGDLRLVQNGFPSSSYTSGRLEVYYSGQWGTVCNDLWSSTNSRIACRQLGFAAWCCQSNQLSYKLCCRVRYYYSVMYKLHKVYCAFSILLGIVVSQKYAHGRSTIQVCQR